MSTSTFPTPASLVGHTIHPVDGKTTRGPWTVAEATETPDFDGWAFITDTRGRQVHVKLAECFATEAEATALARSRRKPRTPRATSTAIPGGIAHALQIGAIR